VLQVQLSATAEVVLVKKGLVCIAYTSATQQSYQSVGEGIALPCCWCTSNGAGLWGSTGWAAPTLQTAVGTEKVNCSSMAMRPRGFWTWSQQDFRWTREVAQCRSL